MFFRNTALSKLGRRQPCRASLSCLSEKHLPWECVAVLNKIFFLAAMPTDAGILCVLQIRWRQLWGKIFIQNRLNPYAVSPRGTRQCVAPGDTPMCPPLESPRLEVTTILAVPAGEYTAWCRQCFLLSCSRSDARGWVRQCCGGCLRFKHSGRFMNRPYGMGKFKIAALLQGRAHWLRTAPKNCLQTPLRPL